MNRDHSRRFADSPIRRLMLLLIVQSCFAAMAQAQSPNMTGSWMVAINFSDGNKLSLRFYAQDNGKGTFLLMDPMLMRCGPAKPSEAMRTSGDHNSLPIS